MAGDWIKFEVGTHDKPEVWAISDRLDIDPDAVVGKLVRLWAWFDQHTEEGNAPTVTKRLLDRLVSVTGFCDAVVSAGWMLENEGNISLPNFDRHNGRTAKNRAVTAKRVAAHKSRTGNGAIVSGALPKEEKRREEKIKEHLDAATPAKRAIHIPNDFKPTEDHRKLAGKHGISLPDELAKFRDHFAANGKPMKDWNAAFSNWIRRAPSMGGVMAPQTQQEAGREPTELEAARTHYQELYARHKANERLSVDSPPDLIAEIEAARSELNRLSGKKPIV